MRKERRPTEREGERAREREGERARERERERESALHCQFGWYVYRPGEEGATSIRLLVAIGRGVATMLSMAVVVVKRAVCMGIPPRRRRRLRRMVYGVQSGLKGVSGDSGDT